MKKKLNITLGIIYYVIGSIFFFYLGIFSSLFGIIYSFSITLFIICYMVIPLLILIIPIIIKKIFKKEYYMSFIFGGIITIIYLVILFLLRISIINYMRDFTSFKWNKYMDLRYLMINDLESKYNLIGMEIDEVIDILGQASVNENNHCYFLKSEWIDIHYYCLEIDENNIVTSVKKIYID